MFGRADFDDLCRRVPGIWATLTATLARRLARAPVLAASGALSAWSTRCTASGLGGSSDFSFIGGPEPTSSTDATPGSALADRMAFVREGTSGKRIQSTWCQSSWRFTVTACRPARRAPTTSMA